MNHRRRLIADAIASGLTPRQSEALYWHSEGCTIAATAIRMGIAPATVAAHLLQARRRKGANNTIHLLTLVVYREAA